jgi:hypothetical protein
VPRDVGALRAGVSALIRPRAEPAWLALDEVARVSCAC